jgi:hypothetical protein
MTYPEFSRLVFAVWNAIQDSLAQFPATSAEGVPADWNETKSRLIAVAEELMICPDVENAVAGLQRDKVIMIIVQDLLGRADDADFLTLMQRAYETAPTLSENFPGQPFAVFLIEFANTMQPIRRNNN